MLMFINIFLMINIKNVLTNIKWHVSLISKEKPGGIKHERT